MIMELDLKKITLDLQRVCGEVKFLMYCKSNKVEKAFFLTNYPFRGFDNIVKGKNPIFALYALMRICGICHAAHGIASAEAIEDAMGITPPMNGRYMREILGLVNRVQSHLMHLVMAIPDFVEESKQAYVLKSTLDILNETHSIMTKLGGSSTHPSYITIGGVEKIPNEKILSKIIENIGNLRDKYAEYRKELINCLNETYDYLRTIKFKPKFLGSDLFYGDKYSISVDKIKLIKYSDFHDDLPDVEFTPLTLALYEDNVVETGPRARLAEYYEYNNDSLWGLQEARLLEIELSYKRIYELLEKLELGEPCQTKIMIYRSGKGVSVFEAPRGILVHKVVLNESGRIENYTIILPTMFLVPVIEKATQNIEVRFAEVIPRIYDPCIPCYSAYTLR